MADLEKLAAFGTLMRPDEAIEPILAKPVRSALLDWLTEIWEADALAEVGLKPRHRALFDGKPGVGKTTLAHHLAARLGLVLVAVRPERLISKWVGETARNIGNLFDAALVGDDDLDPETDTPVVLFFDEFDAIARQRREADQGADDERNAFVNTLLQCVERHDGFVIAATNFGASIDQAMWRRFDIHITIDLPGQFERERIIARYLSPFGLPQDSLQALAEAFATASPALMRQFCEGLKRQIVIGPKIGWDMGREAAIERQITSIQPHPDLGKPRLWSQGKDDIAIRFLPWPLPRANELVQVPVEKAADPEAGEAPGIIPFRKGRHP